MDTDENDNRIIEVDVPLTVAQIIVNNPQLLTKNKKSNKKSKKK